MLRQAHVFGLRQGSRLKPSSTLMRPFAIEYRNAITRLNCNQKDISKHILAPVASTVGLRYLSSQAKEEPPKSSDDDTKEIVLTPGQKVAAASRLTMWAGIFTNFATILGEVGDVRYPRWCQSV